MPVDTSSKVIRIQTSHKTTSFCFSSTFCGIKTQPPPKILTRDVISFVRIKSRTPRRSESTTYSQRSTVSSASTSKICSVPNTSKVQTSPKHQTPYPTPVTSSSSSSSLSVSDTNFFAKFMQSVKEYDPPYFDKVERPPGRSPSKRGRRRPKK